MKFAEFKAGMVFKSGPYHMNKESMIEFAQQYDPQWFHIDEKRAVGDRWGGLIASGWQTCGIAMKMAVDTCLADSESFASPGLEFVKWLKPVRPGDDLFWKGTIKATRVSTSRPGVGIMLWSWDVTNQNQEIVLQLDATSLFDISEKL